MRNLEGYDFFLNNLCKHGLPKKEDAFDFAALCLLRFERKRKAEKMKELQDRINKRNHRFDIPEEPPKVESPGKGSKKKGKGEKSKRSASPKTARSKGKGKKSDKPKSPPKSIKGKGKASSVKKLKKKNSS
eukprot:CAMPEP_0197009182 /NCGR_PEP_ID=MMETSP1380-20130617/48831_1 /TAXON_ID=5936 /ORGANISM="Euplotes crassus, Strain CT5" /LENGTH=130 /DNA_ID=CAMNT_0042430251 /DNA_START=163 /DNA_END=553 /DNA_ORIENTATION=-